MEAEDEARKRQADVERAAQTVRVEQGTAVEADQFEKALATPSAGDSKADAKTLNKKVRRQRIDT